MATTSNLDDDIEMNHLITAKIVTNEESKALALYERIWLSVDEHTNVKVLMRRWKPRLEFIVRLMIVSTFLDDSFHSVMQFSDLVKEISQQSSVLNEILIGLILGLGLLAQFIGSVCVIFLIQPNYASMALIGWTIIQPVLFGQMSNIMLIAESLTLIGGLLMMRDHLLGENDAWVQLIGRCLLPMTYLYYAGQFLLSAFTLDETSDFAVFLSSLSAFVIYIIAILAFVLSSILVTMGLKSRFVAFVLGIGNLVFVFYQHWFVWFLVYENGKWKYKDTPDPIFVDDALDVQQIYDLHRYYFFLGISTSGALFLLAQFGPGEIAAEKDEVLLPVVSRAQD